MIIIKRKMFPQQQALGMDPKENTTALLPMGRCLATDLIKERIAQQQAYIHSYIHYTNKLSILYMYE
jgi:hypothetical protein